MSRELQIPNPRERALVGLADAALRPFGWMRRRQADGPIRRVLLVRLERIGDLLMTLDALALAKAAAGEAEVDLAVGSWNRSLADLIPGLNEVHALDVPWLARDSAGDSWPRLLGKARQLRRRQYDLAINFEPDIRSNILTWLSGARRRVGYWTGGGGALLSDALAYEPAAHTRENAERLVRQAFGTHAGALGASARPPARLALPEEARRRAAALLPGSAPFVGVHASGGRPSKQWHVGRFAAAARSLAERHRATLVLTGGPADRPLVDALAADLGDVKALDLCGQLDLPTLAAVLERLDLLITGDTGPMHLAAAVGTPLVALFGPSDPRRYGPAGSAHEVLRIQLPCSPCGMVRLPPERCRNRVPECLDGISVAAVVAAAERVLGVRPRHGAI